MGRRGYSNRTESDRLKKIQTWWLNNHGYFDGGWRSGGIKWTNSWAAGTETNIGIIVNISELEKYLRIYYTQTEQNGSKNDFNYKVQLTTTPCYYGGNRYWLICPLIVNGNYCGRRVGVLYKAGDYFGCRHCYNLTYESRNENRRYKMYPLFAELTDLKKGADLEKEIKRSYYAGRPTRKQRKLMRILQRMIYHDHLLKKAGVL